LFGVKTSPESEIASFLKPLPTKVKKNFPALKSPLVFVRGPNKVRQPRPNVKAPGAKGKKAQQPRPGPF